MKICILGGTGFLGRHLCEQLEIRRVSASIISRNPDQLFLSSYAPLMRCFKIESDESDAELSVCDVLIHLASNNLPSVKWNEPAVTLARSTIPEIRFFQKFASINPKARVIYASSGGQIYGFGHARPIIEDTINSPHTSYALGKQAAESALRLLETGGANSALILRIGNPVGRWQLGRGHGFVSAAVTASLKNTPLTVFGAGTNVRDYFDADDLAVFLADQALAGINHTGTFNIGSGKGYTERDIIALVSYVTGRRIQVVDSASRPFDINYAVLDSSKAKKILKWCPITRLEDSIKSIAEFCGLNLLR